MPTSSWDDLLVEKDQRPLWEQTIELARGEYPKREGVPASGITLAIVSTAWRSMRLDIVSDARTRELWPAQDEVMKEIARLVALELDWSAGVSLGSNVDELEDGTEGRLLRLIVRVPDGRLLEGPINLLARFKERWQG